MSTENNRATRFTTQLGRHRLQYAQICDSPPYKLLRADDPRLLGIPRSRSRIIYPQHDDDSKDYPHLSVKEQSLDADSA